MEEISLIIDGQTVLSKPGGTVWEAARAAGISIPTLCHHPDLKPAGACRICLVEDETSGRMLASCVTPAAPGMVIRTRSPEVLRHRANIVRLLMASHPESCIVCDQGNRCGLRAVASDLGIGLTGLYPMKRPFPLEEANPFIVRDLSKCILCGRCVRADRELVVVGAIDVHHRGFSAKPATFGDRPLERSSCTFCGTCVSLCPTGALRAKTPGVAGSPEIWSETVCGLCAAGCSLSLGTSGGRIVDVEPSKRPGTVNGATLCVRGHFELDCLNGPDRLAGPLLDREGDRVPVPWDEALEAVARGLRRVRDEYGPQSVALLGIALVHPGGELPFSEDRQGSGGDEQRGDRPGMGRGGGASSTRGAPNPCRARAGRGRAGSGSKPHGLGPRAGLCPEEGRTPSRDTHGGP